MAACSEALGQLDEAAQAWQEAEALAVRGEVWESPIIQQVFAWSRAACQGGRTPS